MQSKLSVVLPVYNAEKYLEEAITSVLNQSYKDYEFIIINDGSKDCSGKIIEDFSKNDSRIVYVSRENRGLISTLNEAIALSRGQYLMRMDADDICHPEKFKKQIELIESSQADACGCHWIIISEKGKIIDSYTAPLDEEAVQLCLTHTVPFAHGSVLLRKSFLEKHQLKYGISKHRYAEDYELWLNMHEKGAKFVNVNDFLFYYRSFAQSLSKKNLLNHVNDSQQLRRIFLQKNLSYFSTHFERILKTDLSVKEEFYCSLLAIRLAVMTKNIGYITQLVRSKGIFSFYSVVPRYMYYIWSSYKVRSKSGEGS